MKDSLFIEITDGIFTTALKTLGDGKTTKRSRGVHFRSIVNMLVSINLIPKDAKVVGLGYGCDTLGVQGIFVILEKTAMTGLPSKLYEEAVAHGLQQKVSDATRQVCFACGAPAGEQHDPQCPKAGYSVQSGDL